MAWRWRAPDGRQGYMRATQAEAIEGAVVAAGKIKASRYPMDAKTRDQLWASLVRAGWRLTEE